MSGKALGITAQTDALSERSGEHLTSREVMAKGKKDWSLESLRSIKRLKEDD